mgnify:CR=1 FL=1
MFTFDFSIGGRAIGGGAPIPFNGGLIVNGGFEDALNDWAALGFGEGATGVVTREALFLDGPVLAFEFTNTAARGVQQTVTVEPGVPYDYSYTVYNSISTGDLRFQVNGDVSGNIVSEDTLTDDTIVNATGTMTTGASDTAVTVFLRTRANGAFNTEIDNVRFQLTAPVAANALPDVVFTAGVPITPIDVAADFTGGGMTYTLTSGQIPDGLVLSGLGVLSGTPTTEEIEVVEFTGTNVSGSAATSFQIAVGAALVAPVNTILPIVAGTFQIGETVSCQPGTWTGNPTPTITTQWTRAGVNIPGATSSTYTLVAADDQQLISCEETATNSQGSATADAIGDTPLYVPPSALGALPNQTYTGNTGVQTIATAGDFTGAGGAFSLATSDPGVTIDTGTGVISVDTVATGTINAENITATYTNSGGSANSSFFLTVTAGTATIDEDWYWHVVSLTHNGNLPEDGGAYVGNASEVSSNVTLRSSGDVIIDYTTLPNLTNPLTNNFVHTTGAVGANVDHIFVDAQNFIGEPTSGTAYDGAVNGMAGTWAFFNTQWGTNPEVSILTSIPEPGVLSVPWSGLPAVTTRQEFTEWSSYCKGNARRDWFNTTLVNGASAAQPTGTFGSVDVMEFIWDAIRGTALNDYTCADWYSDAAPHGNPDWYAIQGMTIWTIMMVREGVTPVPYPTATVTWEAGVTATFIAESAAVATRLSELVQGIPVVPNAPQTDEITVATGTGAAGIQVTVVSVPEVLTNIEYSLDGGSGWQNLGRTTAGIQDITATAGNNVYDMMFRYTNATGTGRVSTSDDNNHWRVTSNAGVDVTPPTLTVPTDDANGDTASTASVSTNEGNGILYAVVTTSATAPSVAQIQAGQDNTGAAAAFSASQAVSGTGVQTITPAPSGLSASTAYTTHFQHADASGNDSTVASASGFTTDAAPDVTAPTLSSPTDASNGETASTGSVSTNEGNGTLYWVVTTSGTAPSVAQIQAGQDNTGTAATASGNQSVSGTGVQTITPAPSGLTASTAYTTHFQHADAAGNDSAVSSASGFTTDAAASSQWTAWRTAGTVAIDGANAGGEWDPAPSVSVLATADNSNANLFIGSSTAEYAEGVFATNFGFSTGEIPASSTINGIEVRFVDSQSDIGGRPWYYTNVFITVDGSTNDGTAKSPTSDTVTSATGDTITIPSTGGDTDVWGTSITDSEVRGTNFGIHFSCGATAETPVLAATDQLEIRVNYT